MEGEDLEQKSNDWESARRKHIHWAYKKIFRKVMKKKKVEIAFTEREVQDKGRRTPIKSMKSKINFNQWEAQQKSIPEKDLGINVTFGFHYKAYDVIRWLRLVIHQGKVDLHYNLC